MQTWKKQDRDLVKGDIIRTKVSNESNPRFGEYCYAICSGGGFGCSISTMGNAIFVDFPDFDLNKVLANKDKKADIDKGECDRWERFWGIEYMEETK